MQLNTQRTLAFALVILLPTLANCGSKSALNGVASTASVEDNSPSVAAAGAVGGALSSANASGTQAQMLFRLPSSMVSTLKNALSPLPNAYAASLFCPTFKTTSSACSASGSSLWLSYDNCTFTGHAEWNGVQEISMSSGSAVCGQFPNPGASGTLYRQYVTASGSSTPGEVTLTADGSQGLVDDASANLANFDSDTIATINNGGYGVAVQFNAQGERSQLTIGHHLAVTGSFDHSLSGTLNVSEASGATSRTISGSMQVYHNLLKVIGTSTFNNVVHDNVCCLPVSGTITTVFTAGTNVLPTKDGQKYVGQSEKLTITGCGLATLQQIDGTSVNLTLNRCF